MSTISLRTEVDVELDVDEILQELQDELTQDELIEIANEWLGNSPEEDFYESVDFIIKMLKEVSKEDAKDAVNRIVATYFALA